MDTTTPTQRPPEHPDAIRDAERDLPYDSDELDTEEPWAIPLVGDDNGEEHPPVDRSSRDRVVRNVVDAAVVVLCAAYAFFNLHPGDILSSAVPAGGDMGAHVWGPAYLRDNLLPDLRLSGWTPDWYAGFPAYQFYMVVPSLLIVLLDVGIFGGPLLLVPLLGGIALAVWTWRRFDDWRAPVLTAAVVMAALLLIELPYGTAFKLVSIAGVLTLPAAAYAFGRLADLAFPGPALLSVAALVFLFDRNFTIYGGNVASTLAGEFAFSISLSLAVVYLGVVVRGLRTGRHRALAALLLALAGLCHLIPAFYALGGTAVIALLRRPAMRTLRWLAGVLPVGGLLSAFWVLPFFWQRAFVNDMGWEKLPHDGETIWKYLIPRSPDSPVDLRWVLALALMGLVLSAVFRLRAGWILAGFVIVSGVAFVLVPQGRLWNARLLPFYYLSLYMLAAVGVAEVGRTIAVLAARDPERPSVVGPALTAGVGMVVAMVMVGIPLRTLPFGETRPDGSYSFFGIESAPDDSSFVRSWAKWNYTGYEGKDAYAEYRDVVKTMADVGEDHGCGRAFWEYEKELNRYGTPMALMLLPHWTDGCIGSMEGLFFEASATTPFHFLTQVELSAAPSAAQRDLPYAGFDIDKGVEHLQLMGVRYYMATSVQATTAAREHPALTEIATSGPWVIFQVADSELVEPLDAQPAVLEGVHDAQHDWICATKNDEERCMGPAVAWFTDPDRWDVFLASSGPDAWQRVAPGEQPAVRPTDEVSVDDVEIGRDHISFDVDQPGAPVLVKASYFPNWRASGADGPYRVAPNLMVVVPTDDHVELTYGREPIEWLAYLLTALGIVGLVWLARRPRWSEHGLRSPRPQRDWAPLPQDMFEPVSGDLRASILVPALDEADDIGSTVAAIRSALSGVAAEGGLEIIVIDDGSSDGTADAALAAGADQVVVLPENRGKGAAVRAGVDAARGRTIAFIDADLAYSPDHLLLVIDAIESGYGIAVGSRTHPDSTTVRGAGSVRDLGSKVINLLTRGVLLSGPHDTQCGLKGFRADVAKELFALSRIDRFAFDIEILHIAERHGHSVAEIPVELHSAGGSTVRVFSDGLQLLRDVRQIRRWSAGGAYDPTPGAIAARH